MTIRINFLRKKKFWLSVFEALWNCYLLFPLIRTLIHEDVHKNKQSNKQTKYKIILSKSFFFVIEADFAELE
jgi:hypothetical protein